MLKEIHITHFAIIDTLRVEFLPGLNVLTGETGAGKSILIDALNLILGGRGDKDAIRSGETSLSVEALFHTEDEILLRLLNELGIEANDREILIKRTLSHAGKTRCFVNDSSLTLASLAKIGQRLVDIHGQHDHQALLRTETHLELLDQCGKTVAAKETLARLHADWQADRKRLQELQASERDRLQKEEFLKFQLAEIDNAGLGPSEEEELKAEKNRLLHAEKLSRGLESTQALLADADGSVLELLRKVQRELEACAAVDSTLNKPSERAQNAYFEVEELLEETRAYRRTIEFNPARLEEIEDRLAEINGLKRKYGADVPEILKRRDALAGELETFSGSEETQNRLKESIAEKESELEQQAVELARERERTAKEIQKKVEKELKDLNMTQVRFGVRFEYEPDPEGCVHFREQRVRLHPTGIGSMEFLFSPNPGEQLRPLAKIASGGELSRVMLALKSTLNEQHPVPVMVFDEVDTGIGGNVAEKVGIKLRKVARGKQVFCITHLPQIAGMASAHYRVQKTVKDKRTHSVIERLDHEQRVREIARMSGGEKITDVTLKHAEQMIKD